MPDTSAAVWPLLTAVGRRHYDYEQDDATARHPSGSLVLSRHRPGTTSADSWTAEATVHLGTYFWNAELHAVPPPPRRRVRHRPDPLGTRSAGQGCGP
ncbi:hypothetical protein [Streptomyces sp. NPDC048002]|uniref:hypothetical protein n=1 Tax=Streptomyces sp. NPDC048002 TaxID=3154344 RepID=UPI0033F0D8C8